MCGFFDSIEPTLGIIVVASWVLSFISLFGAESAARRWETRSPGARTRKPFFVPSTMFLVWPFGRVSRALARDSHPSAKAARHWTRLFRLGVGGFFGGGGVVGIFGHCL